MVARKFFNININVGRRLIFCRLRLAFFKGMGFEPIMEKDGSINKMLVRAYGFVLYKKKFKVPFFFPLPGAQSGDLHVIDFTNGKTDLGYTQLLWKLVNS
jgi:kinetochore protein Spc24, fungi type